MKMFTEEQIKSLESIPTISSAVYDGKLLRVKSHIGKNNLEKVLQFINEENISFGKIYTELPTLNDVFLEITGKELRD